MDEGQLNALLQRVARQDALALRELYQATAGRLLAIGARMLGDRARAEDVLQEVFISVWHQRDRIPTVTRQPLAWLTTLVRHRCIDLLRRSRPEVPLEWQDASGATRHHDVADENGRPEQAIEEIEGARRLDECMSQLGDDPQRALRLAYQEGLTHGELASRLDKPLGTVKAWIRRSLMQLKSCLGEPA